jgi:hypothetical protein
MAWDSIPKALLDDCSQLVKANSIEGNKKNNQTIIYTPWRNIKKTGDMAIGTVTFHNERVVKRHHVIARDNAIVNRLNKTKREENVDHESVRLERERERNKAKREIANKIRNEELNERRQRQAEKEAADYNKGEYLRASSMLFDLLIMYVLIVFSDEAIEAERRRREEEKAARKAAEKEEDDDGMDSDDSFM